MRNVLGRVVVGLGCWFAGAAAGGAQEPESIRAFGDHLFRQGDYYRAITEYERFAFLAPEHPDVAQVRLRIGEAYYFGEKWDAAARIFRALETPETERDVQRTAALYLAAVAMQQKDLQRATDLLEGFLAAHPDDPWRADVVGQLILLDLRSGRAEAAARRQAQANTAGIAPPAPGPADLEEWRRLPRKSPLLAGSLSALLPGAGQAYVGHWSDALLAFGLNAAFFWGTYEAFERDEDVLGCFLLALDTTWYFGNVYNAANGARRVNQDRQKRFFENLDVRYGLVFPPARKDGPRPMLGVGASF